MRNVTVCVPAFGVLLWELATQGMSLCFSLWCVAMGTGNTGHVTVFQPLVCCYGNWQHRACHCVSAFGVLQWELARCRMSLCFISLWCVALPRGTGYMWNVTICVPAFDVLLWELATCGMSPFVFQLLVCCYGNWLHVECHHLCSSLWRVAMGTGHVRNVSLPWGGPDRSVPPAGEGLPHGAPPGNPC